MPWCFLVALLGYGRRLLRSSSGFVTYAGEASYPVYLLHQTVIVAVAFVVVQWEVGVAVKFAAILSVSLLVSVLVYRAGDQARRRHPLPLRHEASAAGGDGARGRGGGSGPRLGRADRRGGRWRRGAATRGLGWRVLTRRGSEGAGGPGPAAASGRPPVLPRW